MCRWLMQFFELRIQGVGSYRDIEISSTQKVFKDIPVDDIAGTRYKSEETDLSPHLRHINIFR